MQHAVIVHIRAAVELDRVVVRIHARDGKRRCIGLNLDEPFGIVGDGALQCVMELQRFARDDVAGIGRECESGRREGNRRDARSGNSQPD